MNIVKLAGFSLIFAVISLFAPIQGVAQSSPAGFVGTWVLDREKTNAGKDFPRKLKNYKVTVAESERLLNVKSEVEGRVEVEIFRGLASNSDVRYNQNRVTRASPTGLSGSSLGTDEEHPEEQKINYGGTMALSFTPSQATYNLNGEEVKLEIKQGDKVTGVARIKAKLDKSGNQIQFTTIRQLYTLKGDMEITTREVWKLSKDGKSLKLERTVVTSVARDEIQMVLARVP